MRRRTARPVSVILLLAAAFLSSGMAAAQGFGGRAGRSLVPPQRVLENLGISEEQLGQINQLKEDAKITLGFLKEEQREYRQQTKTLLESGNPNPTDLGNAVLSDYNVGEEIRALRDNLREEFLLILTPEQLTTLEEEFNSNRQRRRGFRQGFRGGRDGPPGGEF